jgi:DNA-binding NarL/FixJ family response regulator
MSNVIPTLIVDDHALIREGIGRALKESEFKVIAEAASLSEAIAQVRKSQPKMILLDLQLPDGSGLDLIPLIREIDPSTSILILTVGESYEELSRAKDEGASAYLLKSAPISQLLAVMRIAIRSPNNFVDATQIKPQPRTRVVLTARECEVLGLLGTGVTAKEMAAALFLSEATIKSHLATLYRKLEAKNRIQAIARAKNEGLLNLK